MRGRTNGMSPLTLMVLICALMSCQRKSRDNFLQQNELTSSGYHVAPSEVIDGGIHLMAKTTSDLRHNELVVMMKIENNSDDDILVDYLNCVLKINESRVAVPEILNTPLSTIPEGDAGVYEIHFHPINSLSFYNNASYVGDMKQQYSIDLNFITSNSGRQLLNQALTLVLDDTTYQQYQAAYGRQQSMQLFNCSFTDTTFAFRQRKHLQQIGVDNVLGEGMSTLAPTVFAVTPSITINRMIFSLYSYKEKDTLVVNMRMLNEDSHALLIDPKKSAINLSGVGHPPVKVTSDSFEGGTFPDGIYTFSPGTRLHLQLKYHAPDAVDKWLLSNEWLRIKSRGHSNKLFVDNISFVELKPSEME